MKEINKKNLIDEINASSTKACIITTGGGTDVFPSLLSRGGGSNTLLYGLIPYSKLEVINILGSIPDKMCSPETARALAMRAYQKAINLRDNDYDVIGIACTASLQRVPRERNERTHKIYVALQTKNSTHSYSLIIPNPANFFTHTIASVSIRYTEELIASNMILNALAKGCGIDKEISTHFSTIKELISYDVMESDMLGNILSGESKYAWMFDGNTFDGYIMNEKKSVLFPGSFNPMHSGHEEMINIIEAKTGKTCYPEISLINVDKPPLDFISVRDRSKQIGRRILITDANTFVAKSMLFPDISFVVGHDTYLRILNPVYAGSIDYVCSVFEGNRNYFYIFPRNGKKEGLWGTEATALPGEFVMEPRKHEHVSSSAIRKENHG